MLCPCCNKELVINDVVFRNAERYQRNATLLTECCNKTVVVHPRTVFDVTPYAGDRTTDDWGNPVRKVSCKSESVGRIAPA